MSAPLCVDRAPTGEVRFVAQHSNTGPRAAKKVRFLEHLDKEPCTNIARAGTCSFFVFTHLTVEVSVLFIYLEKEKNLTTSSSAGIPGGTSQWSPSTYKF